MTPKRVCDLWRQFSANLLQVSIIGRELIIALNRTQAKIRLIETTNGKDRLVREMQWHEAIKLVENSHYEGVGSRRKVMAIRRIIHSNPWTRCWRTDKAAVCPPWNHEASTV